MDNRAWIECTKWTGNDAYRLVFNAVEILKQFGYDIRLDNNDQLGFGNTQIYSDGSLSYTVGIREIVKNQYSRFPIHEALAPTVACFHEVCGHGWQWRYETRRDTSLSKVLLLNDIACKKFQ